MKINGCIIYLDNIKKEGMGEIVILARYKFHFTREHKSLDQDPSNIRSIKVLKIFGFCLKQMLKQKDWEMII